MKTTDFLNYALQILLIVALMFIGYELHGINLMMKKGVDVTVNGPIGPSLPISVEVEH